MSPVDIIIIALNLIISAIIGIGFRGKHTNPKEYFLGDGTLQNNFSRLIVGLSIAATLFSGISFLAYPSIAYASGLGTLLVVVSIIPAYIILRFWFLDKYMELGCSHPYEIIGLRFGKLSQVTVSILYIIFRLGWMGTLIYVPVLTIISSTGLSNDYYWPLVVLIGGWCTTYTMVGGLRGVVYSDALQFIIILVGIISAITYLFIEVSKSPIEGYRILVENNREFNLNLSINYGENFTVWSIIMGIGMVNCAIYMGDSMTLQRYLALGSRDSALQSFRINIIGALAVLTLLIFLGTGIFIFYVIQPDLDIPDSPDKILPYFCVTQLPVGLSGLFVSAIIAATMSSVTSGINSLCSTIYLDTLGIDSRRSEESGKLVKQTKFVCLGIGLVATAISGVVGNIGTVWEIIQTLGGLFLGPIFAVMVLSLMSIKLNSRDIITGIVIACIGGGVARTVHFTVEWLTLITFVITILFAFTIQALLGGTKIE